MLVICCLTSNAYCSGYALSTTRSLKTKRYIILNGFWLEDFLLVIDVIKPPGTYLNKWLQLSCRSSKFSNSFPATIVLLYALLDPIRESAKCFNFSRTNIVCKLWRAPKFLIKWFSSPLPSATTWIDLCWILCNSARVVATFKEDSFKGRPHLNFFIVPLL